MSACLRRGFPLTCLLLLAGAGPAAAHDPGLSSVAVVSRPEGIDARMTLSIQDVEPLVPIDADRDGRIDAGELEAARARLETLGKAALTVEVGGRACPAASASVQVDDSGSLELALRFDGAAAGRIALTASLLQRLPRGHREYIVVRDAGGAILAERILRAEADRIEVELIASSSAATTVRTFGRFLLLGIEHILTGYDHIAFLLALLIVGGSFRSILKIVTSFSLAHSITLGLAALDIVRLSPRIVEPLIAVSIVYVAVENLLRKDLRRRVALTFGFGLVHGLGFASALREAGVGTGGTGLAVPLASFNIGVELGQLAVVALVLPLVASFTKNESFARRYAPACSVLIALAGAAWFVARVR